MKTHWSIYAKHWDMLGSPLRPSEEDIKILTKWLKDARPFKDRPCFVLLLGSTPELANLPWPKNTTLLAIDKNLAMLELVLPKNTLATKFCSINGNWLNIPLENAAVDIVVGDGCCTLLSNEQCDIFFRELSRIINPNGLIMLRFFLRPDAQESIENIYDDFISRKPMTFHAFKLRLLMAMQNSLQAGVSLAEVWLLWNELFNHDSKILDLLWPNEEWRTIEHYKNINARYSFASLEEMRMKLAPFFKEHAIMVPSSYELSERCPTLKLKPI